MTMTKTNSTEPFSFKELSAPTNEDDGDPIIPTTTTVKASDGIDLAVYVYEPPSSTPTSTSTATTSTTTALVFYHGGGCHANAGYQHLGRGLARDYGITVYLNDIRGHGASAGPRGDTPSKEQVWKDIDAVLNMAKSTNKHSRIILGGHSSGGGLVVNYMTANGDAAEASVDGCVLVAPELGYRSGTARPGRTEFASVSIWPFIVNAIFGFLGGYKAVRFNYPSKLLEDDPGMVGFNTVNMANAITPETPREQLNALSGSGPPLGLWVGADDELFTAENVAAFVDANGDDRNVGEILPGKNHLGILADVHEPIGQWIGKLENK